MLTGASKFFTGTSIILLYPVKNFAGTTPLCKFTSNLHFLQRQCNIIHLQIYCYLLYSTNCYTNILLLHFLPQSTNIFSQDTANLHYNNFFLSLFNACCHWHICITLLAVCVIKVFTFFNLFICLLFILPLILSMVRSIVHETILTYGALG